MTQGTAVQEREAPAVEPPECRHHWLIESPHGAYQLGHLQALWRAARIQQRLPRRLLGGAKCPHQPGGSRRFLQHDDNSSIEDDEGF